MKKYLVGLILFSSMAFSMETKEKITNFSNITVWPKILSKEISMSKPLQTSNRLLEIALEHSRRYFDRNEQQNLSTNSQEYKLVLHALIAIEKTFPAISRFHNNGEFYAPYFGYYQLALLPESIIKNMSSLNSLEIFFKRYQIVYEGINSELETIKEDIKSIKELGLPPETFQMTEKMRQAIEETNIEIKAANASWKKPELSSPLQFVYFIGWGGAKQNGFLGVRYLIIEVETLHSDTDDEFRALVTIKKRLGNKLNDYDLHDFYETFFPMRIVSKDDAIISIL